MTRKHRWGDVQERTDDGDRLSAENTAKGKLQRIALERLKEKDAAGEIPTSIRFLFYELEQRGFVSKRAVNLDGSPSKRKPDQNLIDAVTHLREIGLVPWDWIVDESRDVSTHFTAETVAEWSAEMVEVAKISRFPGVPTPVILCESRGVGGVLERGVCDEYCVTVCPVGGNCNGHLRTKVAPYLEDPNTLPLYCGDHDLAGDDIEVHTRGVLEDAVGRTFDNWERIMITDKQCREMIRKGMTPILKKDNRFKDGRPHEAFEAEALGQSLVTSIVRRVLERLAPVPLKDVLEREVAERAKIVELLSRRS
jgi:hypothetical protein